MPGRRPSSAEVLRTRAPLPPRLPPVLESVTLAGPELADDTTFGRLLLRGAVSGRTAEAVEFDRCRLDGLALSGARLARGALRDCLAEDADIANLHAVASAMVRVRISACRMTGMHWVDGSLRDVVFAGCRADLAVFRFTRFRHVRFDDCNLAGADFMHADLSGVSFTGCDLARAQFSQATMEGTRFRDCELAGIGGVTSFRGAIMAGQDLVVLSHTLAGALGIRIEE